MDDRRRSVGNLSFDSSDQVYNALLSLPLFLGYITSFFLQGILLVQVFLYHFTFKKDRAAIKATVWFVFILEWASTIIATMGALMSIVQYNAISDVTTFKFFPALAPLCGLVTLVVQTFYCYRIYTLGRHLVIPGIIFILSITQCVMVTVAGFRSPDLGVGSIVDEDLFIRTLCVIWLTLAPIADLLIALTLIVLLTRASQMLPTSKTRLEKLLTVCLETGLITGCAALVELFFFLMCNQSFLHLVFFFMLPKLYSNAMMATLNARLAVPAHTKF